jgi:hypothetical protein
MGEINFSEGSNNIKSNILSNFKNVTPEAQTAINPLFDISKKGTVSTIDSLIIKNVLQDIESNNIPNLLWFDTKVLGMEEIKQAQSALTPESIKQKFDNLASSAPLPESNDNGYLIATYNIQGQVTTKDYKDIDRPIVLKLGADYEKSPRYQDLELICLLAINKNPEYNSFAEELIKDPKNTTNIIIKFLDKFQRTNGLNQGFVVTMSPATKKEINSLDKDTFNKICIHSDTIIALQDLLSEKKNTTQQLTTQPKVNQEKDALVEKAQKPKIQEISTVTIHKGDNLWKIYKAKGGSDSLGDFDKFKIQTSKLNNEKDIEHLKIDDVLVIPAPKNK